MATFNPPYSMDVDVATGVTTFTDKDGKVVDLTEVEAYGASEAILPLN